MCQIIPGMVLSVCAEIAAERESHAKLNSLFTYAGAPGDPPLGNKLAKAMEWLRRTNNDESTQPLDILGKIIENYMEPGPISNDLLEESHQKDREKIKKALAQYELQYVQGGKIVTVGKLGTPSKMLEEFIRERDIIAIELEFNRALTNVESNPREAVSAASNILESLCKIYIDDEGLEKPAKQDLKTVWAIVRKHLNFDPSAVEDQDLQKILTGLISIVEGIGSLRTHASSAHGAGRKTYKLESRHARLAIHSAHTIVLFALESWDKRKNPIKKLTILK